MNNINLIPAPRREAKAHRAHVVKWITGLSAYALILVLGYCVSGRFAMADSRAMNQESRHLSFVQDASRKMVQALQQELTQARQKLQTSKVLGQQPDWGSLMSLLAKNMGDDVVLDFCRLQRVTPEAAPIKSDVPTPAAPATPQLLLELGGFAQSQADVSQYVLRLEKTGLFNKVKIIKTSREAFRDGKAVAFRLECLVDANGGTTP